MNANCIRNIGKVRFLFEGEIMLTKEGKERTEMIVRNIMSGDNNCGTLATAVANGGTDYFYNAAVPVIAAYDAELADIRKQRDDALKAVENLRFHMEGIASNLHDMATVKNHVMVALPGRRV